MDTILHSLSWNPTINAGVFMSHTGEFGEVDTQTPVSKLEHGAPGRYPVLLLRHEPSASPRTALHVPFMKAGV